MKRVLTVTAAVLVLAAAACARAGEAEKLYEIDAKASRSELAVGEKGSVAVQIKTRGKAYVHKEAPLKMAVSAKNLALEKDSYGRADAQRLEEGPRFEVPFTAERAGQASLDAELTFFICTEKLCERQARKLSVPVTVK